MGKKGKKLHTYDEHKLGTSRRNPVTRAERRAMGIAVATGHHPHIGGAGAMDSRPKGQRDRSNRERRAVLDAID